MASVTKPIYHMGAIISRGLYTFYPIFHCGLYCRAVQSGWYLIILFSSNLLKLYQIFIHKSFTKYFIIFLPSTKISLQKTPFLMQLKKIFGPFYFVTALCT